MYKRINLLINRQLSSGKNFIRNRELPICSNCLYFIQHSKNYPPYDTTPSNKEYGRCNKFGEVNLITGDIEYDLAQNCRLNVSKCGNYGSEYTKKT